MPNDPADLQRMRDAIAALPEPTRTIYLAHLRDDLDYRAIAAREALSLREVEHQIARALMLIDRFLRDADKTDQ